MKAALYIRVSTDDQAREGYSIPAQLKSLNDYCKREGITIYNYYIDEGQPGSKENRPQFQKMLKDAAKKTFDIILVHKYDRFARKVELSQRIKSSLRKSGINVISITEPIEDSPIGFFQEGMMELLAEYYIKNLSQEVKKGQKEKISQGKPCNMLPYGYKNINGTAIVIDEQANIVRKIFELYNQGNGSQTISNYLNDRGIPTMKRGIWNSGHINYILRNDAYTGVLKWGKEKIEGALPVIIPLELFKTTQSKINVKLRTNRATYFNQFILLGILRCGYCSSPMRISKLYSNGNKNGKAYYMYNCRQSRYSRKRCSFSKHIQYQQIEEFVINYIEDISKGVRNVDNFIDHSTDVAGERIKKIEIELDRVKRAYLAEVFTLEEYKDEKQRLEDELHLLLSDKNEEKIKLKMKNKIGTYYDKFRAAKTVQDKKVILQDIIEYIDVYEDALNICFKA